MAERLATQGDELQSEETIDWITVGNDRVAVDLDRATGTMSRLKLNGKDVLLPDGGPSLIAYRAPTDNDMNLLGDWNRYDRWKAAGLDDLRMTNVTTRIESARENVMIACDADARATPSSGFHYRCTYTIDRTGVVLVDGAVDPYGELPPLPRVGLTLSLPSDLRNIRWYGRGPHENYNDREGSAEVGRYSRRLSDMLVPYARPQENGNSGDCRRVLLQDESGAGLLVVAEDEPFSFSALPYTATDLPPPRTRTSYEHATRRS